MLLHWLVVLVDVLRLRVWADGVVAASLLVSVGLPLVCDQPLRPRQHIVWYCRP